MRRALLLAWLLACPALVQAQANPAPQGSSSEQVPFLVRWGKWGAALLFAGLTAYGAYQHEQANADYVLLRQYCLDVGPCTIGPDGRYTDPGPEALYQQVVQGDRTARASFIAGQVALAGTAALFVMELSRQKGTENIPYSGLTVAPSPYGLKVGWRLSFGSP